MRKLLILVEKIGPRNTRLFHFFKKSLEKSPVKTSLKEFSDLTFDIWGRNTKVKVGKGDISDFDLLYVRWPGRKHFWLANALAIWLDFAGIKYFDLAYFKGREIDNKLADLLRLSLVGLPVPPSFYCPKEKIKNYTQEIISKFGFPLVAKNIFSHQGRGVFLLENKANFSNLDEHQGQFLFQKFYPNDGDFRLLVLGEKVKVWEKRIRKKGEYRNNVALGAKEKFLRVADLPKRMGRIAVKAAKVLNWEIAGVDILVDNQGKIWLLEVNGSPAFTYDLAISPEIPKLAEFLIHNLDKEKK